MERILLELVILMFSVTELAAENMNRRVGEDCELQCDASVGSVEVLEWTKSDKYLLIYRDGKIREKYQDKHFTNRVEMLDPELKRGNLGVILKNLRLRDSGEYTCEGLVKTPEGRRRFTHHIELTVTEDKRPDNQDQKDSNNNKGMGQVSTTNEEKSDETEDQRRNNVTAVAVGVSVSLVLVFLVAGILYWKRKQIKEWLQEIQPNHII